MSLSNLCSVIIPTYNCMQFIEQTILYALSQTHKNVEVIVIDDCSTDSTYTIVCRLAEEDLRIKAYQNKRNLGVALTRNRGFKLASGQYIALLDGDDIWYPKKLTLQIEQLGKSHTDICCTSYEIIDRKRALLGKYFTVPSILIWHRLLKQNFIGCSTAVFRREVVRKIQMRPEYSHEDYVFWLEAVQAGFKLTAIKEPLMQYRVLKSSRSAHKIKAAHNRWKIYRQFLRYSLIKSFYYFVWYIGYSTLKRL